MKRFSFFLTLGAVLGAGSPVWAQTPVQITQQLISEITRDQSLDPVVEHVDWQGALDAMDPAQRSQMNLKSLDDLKNQEIDAYKGVGGKVSETLEHNIAKSPANQGTLKAMKERLDKSLADQQAAEKKAFSEISYSVGQSRIGDKTAEVDLVKKRGDSLTSETLQFVNVNGKWKLKSAAAFNPAGSSDPHTQLQTLLGPSAASPNDVVLRR